MLFRSAHPCPAAVPHFLRPRLQVSNPFVGFAVPSVVVPGSPSRNVLLNPLHGRMPEIRLVGNVPLTFDERLRPAAAGPPLAAKTKRPPGRG